MGHAHSPIRYEALTHSAAVVAYQCVFFLPMYSSSVQQSMHRSSRRPLIKNSALSHPQLPGGRLPIAPNKTETKETTRIELKCHCRRRTAVVMHGNRRSGMLQNVERVRIFAFFFRELFLLWRTTIVHSPPVATTNNGYCNATGGCLLQGDDSFMRKTARHAWLEFVSGFSVWFTRVAGFLLSVWHANLFAPSGATVNKNSHRKQKSIKTPYSEVHICQ